MNRYTEIYLIDDFDMVNTLHLILLRKLGVTAEVRGFTEPRMALENLETTVHKSGPILVLLDIKMPKMSGFKFLEYMVLKKFPSTVDVVIVTSSVSDRDRSLALKYSQYVSDYVTKPLKLRQLKAITERVTKAV